ncbi:hypothetical protein P3T76_016379 [Phytophthora citrophthora]|uniref:Uncharacterized protein n=1 Tax=Phytophthora citrophthora TaxID=4793 RepID=A0AAD9L9E2_9STRA|nr:hypothetical protein P3T76_016379 [Phytophthora citrophthora]
MQRLVEDAGETCLVARSGDEAVLCVSWTHGGTVDVTRMQRLVRDARLVEDAGETCLVARSGDEGMASACGRCLSRVL